MNDKQAIDEIYSGYNDAHIFMLKRGCWCGEQHISSWGCKGNDRYNPRPIDTNEYRRTMQILNGELPEHGIGWRLAELIKASPSSTVYTEDEIKQISAIMQSDSLPRHLALAKVMELHEKRDLSYIKTMLVLSGVD